MGARKLSGEKVRRERLARKWTDLRLDLSRKVPPLPPLPENWPETAAQPHSPLADEGPTDDEIRAMSLLDMAKIIEQNPNWQGQFGRDVRVIRQRLAEALVRLVERQPDLRKQLKRRE